MLLAIYYCLLHVIARMCNDYWFWFRCFLPSLYKIADVAFSLLLLLYFLLLQLKLLLLVICWINLLVIVLRLVVDLIMVDHWRCWCFCGLSCSLYSHYLLQLIFDFDSWLLTDYVIFIMLCCCWSRSWRRINSCYCYWCCYNFNSRFWIQWPILILYHYAFDKDGS